jgi:hypothetical protein
MNYTTTVGKPTAHITKKKSRLKVYNGHNVFLNDKDNFEFEIHNPTNKTVLSKIKLNGEYISTSGIVIRPGQRVFLERFLDSNNKFEFSTYKVNNTSENRSAIDLNGEVLVEFYDEQTITNHLHLSGGNWGNGWTTINTGSPYWGGATFTTNSAGLNGTCGVGTMTSTSSFYSSTTPEGPNIRYSKFSNSETPLRSLKSKKSIETGRVEKGDKSNQTFTNSYQQFNYNTSHTVKFKILPLSVKNTEVHEIRQYCTECGVKMKKNYKFCPSCGTKA